ncbi:hypothetical protein [Natrinema pallidum]|uniref:Uncharacterized protein n=1 Tax=Natrinema pallidum TaxID=69527 RepID=A0A4P9TG42_9EURY|nr:hypothetical protein [Natrinema pallidum]QCW03803.1 hypothetical protein FGF80_11385 [Natrinema pallidum]
MDRIRDEINYNGLIGSMILGLLLTFLFIIDANKISISVVGVLFILLSVNISREMSEKENLNKSFYLIGGLLAIIAGVIILSWGYILASAILFIVGIFTISDLIFNIK